jgi:hypothetical protein
MNQKVDLRGTDLKRFSQNGEDGILENILKTIGTTNKYYVEFGVGDGSECNTRLLRENGWSGLMMDCDHHDPSIGLHREFINAENINDLFAKYHVPADFDVLSIDIDNNDYWVWKALSSGYKPRVVIIEWNCSISPYRSLVVPYDRNGRWDLTSYFGASILALKKLGESKGQVLVASDRRATNLFFVNERYGHWFEGAGKIESIHPEWVWSHQEDHKLRKYIEV